MKKLVIEGRLLLSEDWHQFVSLDGDDLAIAITEYVVGAKSEVCGVNFHVPGKWKLTLEQVDE